MKVVPYVSVVNAQTGKNIVLFAPGAMRKFKFIKSNAILQLYALFIRLLKSKIMTTSYF